MSSFGNQLPCMCEVRFGALQSCQLLLPLWESITIAIFENEVSVARDLVYEKFYYKPTLVHNYLDKNIYNTIFNFDCYFHLH